MTQSGSFAGTLTVNGGNLSLSGASYSGTVNLNVGTTTLNFEDRAFSAALNINDGAVANVATTDGINYSGTASVTVNSGGQLNFGSSRWTFASGNKLTLAGGSVIGEGQTTTNGAGEITDRYGAVDFINSGNVVDVTASSSFGANVRIRGNVDFAIAEGATLDFSGNLYKYSAAGANFSKSGAGTMAFSGTADAGVNVALNAGTTTIDSPDFRGNITIAEGATVSLAGQFVLSQAVSNAGYVSVDTGNIVFDLGGLTADENNRYTLVPGGEINENWLSLTKENFAVNGVSVSGRSGFSISELGAVTLDLTQTAASLVWASLDGSNVWNIENARNWTNDGVVDVFYEGDAVTFSSADATVDIAESLVAGNMTVTENVSFSSTGTDVVFSQIGNGTVSVAEGKTANFDNTIATAGTLEKLGSGKLVVAADASGVASSVKITEGVFGLSVADNDATAEAESATFAGTLTGAGGFEKLGAGTLVLDSAQTYAGETLVSEGTLKITNKNALGTSNRVRIDAGATLDLAVNMDSTENAYVLNGGTLKASVATGSGSRQIASGDGALVLTANSTVQADANFGMISSAWSANQLDLGGFTLTKTGTAEFYLASTAITAGTIDVREGTLSVLDREAVIGGETDFVLNGGALAVAGNLTVKSLSQQSGAISGNGNITINNGGTLSASNSSYSGQFILEGGTLTLGNTSGVLGSVNLEGTGTRYAAVVKTGATLDINGQTEGGNNCYKIELAGGKLVNNGASVGTTQRQITGLKLSADSEIGGSGNFGLIASAYAANQLDLGGFTLTKTGSGSFYLTNTTVTAGTFRIQGGSVDAVTRAVSAGETAFAVESGALNVNVNFSAGDISVSEGASLTFAQGITVALGSTIENAGTVTIGSGMSFNLDNLTPDGKVYTLISGAGKVSGWENLTIDNFTHSTQSNLRLSNEAGVYSVYVYHGALTWVGETDSGAGTWDIGKSANWTYDNEGEATRSNFYDGDEIEFATAGAQVTLADGAEVFPAVMKVSQNVIFDGAGTITPTSLVFENDSTLSLGENVVLDLGSSEAALDISSVEGTGTVRYTHTPDNGNNSGITTSANFAGTVDYTGNLNWADTSEQIILGNNDVTLRLSSRENSLDCIWGNAAKTFQNNFEFATNYKIYTGNNGVTFAGNVDATGVALTIDGSQKVAFSGAETTIGALNLASVATVEFSAGTASIGTLTQTAGTFNQTGGELTLSGGSAIAISQTGGTLNIVGEELTLSDKLYSYGTLNIGDGTATTVTVSRIELGDVNNGGTSSVTVGENAFLQITGSTNNWAAVGDYKTNSVVLGEWNNTTTLTVSGMLWALDAEIGFGDSGGSVIINSGGALAAKGIGSAIPGKVSSGKFELTLNDGGLLVLGASGISSPKNNVSITFNAGTVSTMAESEIAENVTLNSANGTLFLISGDDLPLRISGNLSGSGKLIKDDDGTLTLSGTNTFRGGVSVDAGTLVANGASALGQGAVSVASGATLELGGENVALYSTIENAGTVTISEGTTFVLDNLTATDNVYTLISGARENVSGWDALTDASFSHNSSSAIRKFDTSYSVLVGAGTLTWAGTSDNIWDTNKTANWTLSGVNNSVTFFDGDSVVFNTANAQVSLANDVSVGTMTVSQSLALSGAGTISVASPDQLVFENASTLSVGSDVVLDLGSSSGALDTSKIEGAGTIKYTHTGDGSTSGLKTSEYFNGVVDYTGSLNYDSTSQVSIGYYRTTLRFSSREGQSDRLSVGAGNVSFVDNVIFATDYGIENTNTWSVLNFQNGVNASGVTLTTSGSITFSGTTTLGGLNVCSGTTTLAHAGTVELANANLSVVDGAALSISDGVVLDLGAENVGSLNKNIIGAGTVNLYSSAWGNVITLGSEFAGTTHLKANSRFTINGSVFGNTLRLSASDGTESAGYGFQLTGAYEFSENLILGGNANIHQNGGVTLTFAKSSSVSGDGTYVKRGSNGELTFNGSVDLGGFSTGTGGTTTFAGTTKLATAAISQGTVNFSGAETTITTLSQTGGTVNFSAGTNNVGTLTQTAGTFNQTGGELTLSGGSAIAISQTGGTLNIGDGTATTVTVSRIELGDVNNGGTSSVTVGENAFLQITGSTNNWAAVGDYKTNSVVLGEWNNTTTLTVSGVLNASDAEIGFGDSGGSVIINSGGTLAAKGIGQAVNSGGKFELTLNDGGLLVLGASGISSPKSTVSITFNAGTVSTTAASAIVENVTLNSASGTCFEIGADFPLSISGNLSGSGMLTKTGAGTLTLSGSNTFTGGVSVSAGTLVASSANALGSTTGTVTVDAGATLDLNANMDGTERSYVLGGGTLKASTETGSTKKQIARGDNALRLTADSTVQADADFGMISSGWNANKLDLGGHTLTKTGEAKFFLSQTTVTAGTLRIEEGTIETVSNGGASNASAANVVIVGGSGKLSLSGGLSVGSLSLEVSNSYTDATLSGAGTLTLGDGQIVVRRSDVAALSAVAGTAYTYQVASGDAAFDDAWSTSTFTLDGWDSGWYVESYTNGLLTIAIPEPTTFGLFAGLGALFLVGMHRRRRK